MGYKFFRINCVVLILILSATIYLLVYLIATTSLIATSVLVATLIVMQTFSLLKYIDKTNRDLSRFLNSIKYSDFSQSFLSTARGRTFSDLNEAFSNVVAEFHRARSEKEEQYRYLQTVVQHIGLAVIVFDKDGEVDLINNAAKRLLRVSHLKNIRSLEAVSADLVRTFLEPPHQDKTLVRIEESGEPMTLAIYGTEFVLRDRSFTLISMQNIESELAEQEMAAWQKLIRVMTHEIMNSVTPIASLAGTANDLLGAIDKSDRDKLSPQIAETYFDVRNAVTTIEKRSQGLLRFIDAYRNLTRIPKPDFKIFPVAELLNRITSLMKDQLERNNITVSVTVEPKSLELTADPELIEQVLINLVLNAIQALQETDSPRLDLGSKLDDYGRVIINVIDNGPGISDDVRERIFTPFFTTKKDGSGIGLSLSRQIMRLHKGGITVQSIPGDSTRFTLRF